MHDIVFVMLQTYSIGLVYDVLLFVVIMYWSVHVFLMYLFVLIYWCLLIAVVYLLHCISRISVYCYDVTVMVFVGNKLMM